MQIEMARRGQSMDPAWFEQKQNRMTASICKDVFSHMQKEGVKNYQKIYIKKKLQRKEHPKKSSATHKGLIFGIENEPVAADL